MTIGIARHRMDKRTEKQTARRRPFLMAAGGAALALIVAASLGAWQVREHAGGVTSGAISSERVPPATQAGPVAIAEASMLYLVASSADAEVMAELFALGSIGRPYQVLVLDPSTDDGQILRGLGHMNDERSLLGLPAIDLVDLRSAPAGGTDAAPRGVEPAAVADVEMFQRWQQAQVASGTEPVSQTDGN